MLLQRRIVLAYKLFHNIGDGGLWRLGNANDVGAMGDCIGAFLMAPNPPGKINGLANIKWFNIAAAFLAKHIEVACARQFGQFFLISQRQPLRCVFLAIMLECLFPPLILLIKQYF